MPRAGFTLSQSGHIYVTRLDRGGYKVGFTRNLSGRAGSVAAEFQTAHTIIAAIPGTLADERKVHRELRATRLPHRAYISHETYGDTPVFRAWLAEVPDEYRVNIRRAFRPAKKRGCLEVYMRMVAVRRAAVAAARASRGTPARTSHAA